MTDDPVDNLAECFEAIREGRPAHPVAARWFVVGVLQAARDGLSLDAALGLAGAGQRSLRRRLLTIQRDEHLARALAAVAVDDEVTDWERCQRLAALLPAFMRTWPAYRRAGLPPDDWPRWRWHVWCAARLAEGCAAPLPMTARGLLGVLKRTPACSLNDTAGRIPAFLL